MALRRASYNSLNQPYIHPLASNSMQLGLPQGPNPLLPSAHQQYSSLNQAPYRLSPSLPDPTGLLSV